MTFPMGHFGVGFGIVIIGCALFNYRNDKTIAFCVLGGFLAILPDIDKFSQIPEAVHDSVLMNVFFGHHFIDTYLEGTLGDYGAIFVGLLFMLFSVILYYLPVYIDKFRLSISQNELFSNF